MTLSVRSNPFVLFTSRAMYLYYFIPTLHYSSTCKSGTFPVNRHQDVMHGICNRARVRRPALTLHQLCVAGLVLITSLAFFPVHKMRSVSPVSWDCCIEMNNARKISKLKYYTFYSYFLLSS